MTMNKIIYESEMLQHEGINESVKRINILRKAVKKETNQIVIDALQNEIKAERRPVDVITWSVTKH